MKYVVEAILLGAVALVAWFGGSLFIRLRWPAKLPPDLRFEHELTTDKKLREVAEALAKTFKCPTRDNVVCCGPVRGSAARVLFHSGPDNKGRGEIHRFDYLLQLERRAGNRVRLTLKTNRPYSYLRIRRSEVEPLVAALRKTYGGLSTL
jgi:hypothetical protein